MTSILGSLKTLVLRRKLNMCVNEIISLLNDTKSDFAVEVVEDVDAVKPSITIKIIDKKDFSLSEVP